MRYYKVGDMGDSICVRTQDCNRYNEQKISVGEEVQDRLLTGAFSADNPQGLVLFLEKDESLLIERGDRGITIRSRRGSQEGPQVAR